MPSRVATLAGSGNPGFKDGLGEAASFNSPNGVFVAPDGSIFVADTSNHRIRRISPNGEVTTVAGNGVAGFADGPGKNSRFNQPAGLAIAADGTLFVTDSGNHRIRRITPDGTVSTVAGDGQAGFSNGPASSARFNLPSGLVLDSAGNLFVVELGNHAVRKITREGMVSTVAGTGTGGFAEGAGLSAQFNRPGGLGIDLGGNIVVADTGNHRIRLISFGRPRLTVARSGNDLVFTWPAVGGDWVLESRNELQASAAWNRVPIDPTGTGRTNSVKPPISSGQKYYRLRRP
ncbi:MAG: SMP-30/gluconolactonase/LRE family protein [Verrucomicrobia bacterium]|nr:SMP-30/gluconolactonase/LRE family protein [Verrucomicrobiota bacterium]